MQILFSKKQADVMASHFPAILCNKLSLLVKSFQLLVNISERKEEKRFFANIATASTLAAHLKE